MTNQLSKKLIVADEIDLESVGAELLSWLSAKGMVEATQLRAAEGFRFQLRRSGRFRLGKSPVFRVDLSPIEGGLEVFISESTWREKPEESEDEPEKEERPVDGKRESSFLSRWKSDGLPEEIMSWLEERLGAKPSSDESPDSRSESGEDKASSDAEDAIVGSIGRYYQGGSKPEEEWLAGFLEEGELVLAWLGVYSASPPRDLSDPPDTKATFRFLMTTERLVLVAFPKKGEPRSFELAAGEMRVTDTVGRDLVHLGDWAWKTWLNNDDLYRELAPAAELVSASRRCEVARLNWIRPDSKNQQLSFAARLLEGAGDWGEGVHRLSSVVTSALQTAAANPESVDLDPLRDDLIAAVAVLLEGDEPGKTLAEWAKEWRLPSATQMELVRQLIAPDLPQEEERVNAALPLHRQVRELILWGEQDLVQQSVVDLTFASHLLRAGEREEARGILEERLGHLPDESLSDLLTSKDVDLTTEGSQVVRIRLLELLVDARGDPDVPDAAATAELARLQPLVVDRVKELETVAEGDLARRASEVVALLEPGGLEESEVDGEGCASSGQINTIPKELLEAKLPHPASQKGGALDWVQSKLGQVKAPDHSALRSYAERVTAKKNPKVMEALSDAALALGLGAVEAFISRGDMSSGTRAYEGRPPFVLIGAEHLDPESDHYSSPSSMRFSLASEVAHLRFQHTRLTSSDVWDGIWKKGTNLLEILGAFAGPLGFIGGAVANIGRLSAAHSVLRKAEVVTSGAGKALEVAGFTKVFKKSDTGPEDTEIGDRESQMLAICRLMQLTADRAGLIFCGDLKASVQAIYLSSAEYRVELPLARRHGLVKNLSRRDGEGELINQNLALRLAALLSFYLSEDYEVLREALG